jgi:recombination protein RecA
MPNPEEKKALESALKQLDKLGITIHRLGDTKIKPMEVISTGSLGLDIAIGVGGYPRGRLIELYGHEMSGKSTLALIGMANVQRLGGTVALLDVEHSFDPTWAKKLGVDVSNVLIHQPDYGEQALDAVDGLAASNAVDLIVLDSTAALVPKAELEGRMEDQTMASQARLLSRALRKIVATVGKSKTIVIFINQIRETMAMFGNPNTTPGGKALKFYSSVRLEVSRLTGKDNVYKDDQGRPSGHKVKVKVTKNKVGIPFRQCSFDLYYDRGIDLTSEIPDLATEMGIVELDGKTYKFGDSKWVGHDAYTLALNNDPALAAAIKEKIIHVDTENRTKELPESC